jgi:glycosyltransferase involved in cell wall biosynthesis
MNILFDGKIYDIYRNNSGGICRYFDNLINRLPTDFTPIVTTTRSRKDNHQPDHQNLALYPYNLAFRPGRISSFCQRNYFQFIANTSRAQIAHPTYYSLLTGRLIEQYRCPIVVTVYDMIHEIFRDSMDPKREMAEIKRQALFAAHRVLCISESTKQDLINLYPSLSERVNVIHLATELNDHLIRDQDPIPSKPYYLYVGMRSNYKNFDRVLIAFSKVVPKFPDLILCVIGSQFSNEELQLIAELNLAQNIEYYGRANDNGLAKLYKHSLALIYPSLYEGFGIPPLEAMSCGTTVIASNVSSIPEVVQNAGLLFNPYSVDELVEQILFLLEHPSQRHDLIEKGRQHVKNFSWEKTVEETVNVYRSLA